MKSTIDNLWNLRTTLESLCNFSRKMINIHKSYTIFSKNTLRKFIWLFNKGLKVVNREKLVKSLRCPMDVIGHSLNIFQELPEKVVSTRTLWQFLTLTQVGKLLLINNILIIYALHIMATNLFPKKKRHKITSVILKF